MTTIPHEAPVATVELSSTTTPSLRRADQRSSITILVLGDGRLLAPLESRVLLLREGLAGLCSWIES
jgi:hypothetical protein